MDGFGGTLKSPLSTLGAPEFSVMIIQSSVEGDSQRQRPPEGECLEKPFHLFFTFFYFIFVDAH